jgi:hypothetical protein
MLLAIAAFLDVLGNVFALTFAPGYLVVAGVDVDVFAHD